MSQSLQVTVDAFKKYLKKIRHYHEAVALLHWDLRTGAPRKGVELRSETIGEMSGEAFRLSVSPEMEEFLIQLEANLEELTPAVKAAVREARRDFDRSKKIPQDRFEAFVVLRSKAESVWEEAKETNNFELFRPYLEQIVDMNIEFVNYWGYTGNPYNALLDMYEPGATVEMLDRIFGGLREETVKLVEAIGKSNVRANKPVFSQTCDVAKQRELSLRLLRKVGYDFSAGRLDESVHPFMTTINRFDTRVTTKFLPSDIRSAIFSTIHESGHALYEQGVSPDLLDTPNLSGGTSMGIHESQSRFYENFLGRSRAFWEHNYKEVQELFPSEFGSVSLDEFYLGVNEVEPSLIRIEADEVTYNLHIMIRYEIEKGLINKEFRVADLPEIWRAKMKEYLGVVPPTDSEGVLQDVHWSGGDFGYFPSYSLGNIYAAQFYYTMKKEIPNYEELVRTGNYQVIREWLGNKIHQFGRTLTPAEIVKQVTGEDIDSSYLVRYFHEKLDSLYQL